MHLNALIYGKMGANLLKAFLVFFLTNCVIPSLSFLKANYWGMKTNTLCFHVKVPCLHAENNKAGCEKEGISQTLLVGLLCVHYYPRGGVGQDPCARDKINIP